MAVPQGEKGIYNEGTRNSAEIAIKDVHLGVYHLRIARSSAHQGPKKFWYEVQQVSPFFRRLTVDVFNTAPYHFIVYLICHFSEGLEDLLLLGLSDKLLKIIEAGLVSGKPDVYLISSTLLLRILFSCVFVWLRWYSEKIEGILQTKVTSHFQLLLMKSQLELDLATSKEPGSKSETNAGEGWHAMGSIIRLITDFLKSGSQMAFIAHMSRANGGPWFVLLSLSHPLLSTYFSSSIWDKVCYGYIKNPIYQRIKALEAFATGKLRQDIISGGLKEWITDEFERSNQELGTLSTVHPYYQLEQHDNLFKSMFLKVVEFAPMIFCAFNVAINPLKFSVSSFAILQQSGSNLRISVEMALSRARHLNRSLTMLKNIYRRNVIPHTMRNGVIPYPAETDGITTKGMSFELNDVSFSYPGAQKTTTAVANLSLKIESGQLVVIVGANGSGKSTLIRLLSRLYDPSSGTVDIDGRPSAEYVVSDLHAATALLSQDSELYPFSLGENIGLGYPSNVRDGEMIKHAAEQGGATEFISKLKNGFDTVLDPHLEVFQLQLYNNPTHVLYKEMEALQKEIDISGGERQKIVAARSFMRFRSGKIKFVAVDEPSSALDAEAELKLFENLIKVREGKTMIFVTHRFGHLTRYADQIICMKDGAVCESGSHGELMKKQGEYAKLYEIQASAFAK